MATGATNLVLATEQAVASQCAKDLGARPRCRLPEESIAIPYANPSAKNRVPEVSSGARWPILNPS